MSKQMKHIAAFVIPHACIILFCMIMMLLNLATPFVSDYAIDTDGQVYVGEMRSIKILQNSEIIGAIRTKSSTYAFTVDSNDNIVIAYPSVFYLLDRYGNVLERTEDFNSTMYSQLQQNDNRFFTVNGDRYEMTNVLGWTQIVKNESENVYSISVLSFCVKYLIQICSISMFVNGIWVVHHVRRFHMNDEK